MTAIADTRPKGGDCLQAPFTSGGGAVGNRPRILIAKGMFRISINDALVAETIKQKRQQRRWGI